MPTIPKFTKCLTLGCREERSKFNAYCMSHGGRDTYDHKRYNSSEKRKAGLDKYTSSQWRKLRQIQLSKHPLCAACLSEGRITSALHIDHLFPWSQLGEDAFYINVFQSLCHSCHSIKTTLEQRDIYRLYGIPTRDYKLSDYMSVMHLHEKI
jgi:5-methylcytosine-specific restriction protein A